MKIRKYTLMYCGIQPSEIDEMELEDVELFSIFFEEMKQTEIGSNQNKLGKH